ncbi:Uncharacterized protein FWK35_00024015 [Aphis craccivora]|uniref:DNA pol B 2 domain-containing protein n=1 Tax=Aphis craccivora TaxID=307492 RepID=A0A6G0XN56_APHCR|nr:Uncharacterized protein FWK35_00024015 [Aphis craccivora]
MSDDDIFMAAMDNYEEEHENRECCIVIAPQIFVPDFQAGCSNIMSDDDIFLAAKNNFEKEVQDVNTDSYTTAVNGKRVFTASAARSKRKRIQSLSFVEISASTARTIVWYHAKNMGGVSYIQLPAFIDRKWATINPQNLDQQCFKWVILARLIMGPVACRVGDSYRQHEGKYNFEGISFLTSLSDIKKFEKNNMNVSINVYGLKKKFDPVKKYPFYNIYPIRVVNEKKSNHFNLLVYRGGEQHADFAKRFVEAIVNLGKLRVQTSKCNLELQQPKFVPVFFHNLSNYDSHFIITEFGFDTETISVIPNSEEKFISFMKHISSKFTIWFIDTFRFMASSLSSLVENLITQNFENFRETAKHFVSEDMPLVTRKGVYPYEYTYSCGKLDMLCLPKKEEFYSTLTESGIKEEDFKHAKAGLGPFQVQDVGRVHPLSHAPGLSFDAMLMYTGQKLELLSDYDMLLMFDNGIRCGLVQASMRYAKANNLKCSNYDETKEKFWLVYQDCNNLYSYAMSEYMQYGSFNWVDPNLDGLSELTPKSSRDRGKRCNLNVRRLKWRFCVLNISKTLMYDYHYNVMQRHYGEHIKLMYEYTDTDSLVYN